MSLKQHKILILNKDFSINNIIIRALDNHNCVLIENEQEFIDKLRSDFDIILISDSYATNQYRLIEKVLLTFKGLFIVITNNKDSFNSNNIKKISSPLNIIELRDLIHEYEKTLSIKEETFILNIIKKHSEDDSKKLITLFEPHTRISGLMYLDSGNIVHAEYKDFIGNKAITNLLRMNNPLLSVFNNISIPIITCNYEVKKHDNNPINKEKKFKGKVLIISKNLKLTTILNNFFYTKALETINLDEENKIELLSEKDQILFTIIDDSFMTDLQDLIKNIINNLKNTYLIIFSKNKLSFELSKNVLNLLKPLNLLELEQVIEFNLLNKLNKESFLKYVDNIINDKKIISIKLNDSYGLVYIKNNKIIHAEYDNLLGLEALKYILNLHNINLTSIPWNEPIFTTLNITFKNDISLSEFTNQSSNNIKEKTDENKKKILIVDDDTISTKILSKFLAGKNYFTKTANSAVEGKKILLNESFDLVITDINMPEVNGLEFLLWIKQNFPEIKVLIITSFHNENIRNFSFEKGAFYYFEKPVDLSEMQNLLKKAFSEPTQYSDLKMNDYVKVSMVSNLNKVIEIIDVYTQNKSYIYIKDGKIIHAESGDLSGIDALHEIFKSENGIFSDIPWKEPDQDTISYNDLLLFTNNDNNQSLEQKQTVTERLHSIVDKIRSETETFNKYTIYEEGVALEIILGKTTKNEVLKIMNNYSSEKFKFDDVSQILIYQDLSLTILFSENEIVSEMRFGKLYKGKTSKGLGIGDDIKKGLDIYGRPDVFTLKGAIWKNIALFTSDGNKISSIRIRHI